MRLPPLRVLPLRVRLGRPPRLTDVSDALLAELAARAPAGRPAGDVAPLPNVWTVRLDPVDCARRGGHLASWSRILTERLRGLDEHYGVAYAGAVSVGFAPAEGLGAGRLRVESHRGNPTPERDPHALPSLPGPLLVGHPRLVLPVGGTVAWGHAAAAGAERVIDLPAGRYVVGRAPAADIRLMDPTVSPEHASLTVAADGDGVLVRDLGSRNGIRVDGRPVARATLVDGNRLQLGDTTLVYKRDDIHDDGGRQGGETWDQIA